MEGPRKNWMFKKEGKKDQTDEKMPK